MATEILRPTGSPVEGWPTVIPEKSSHYAVLDEAVLDEADYIQADDDYGDEAGYTDTFTIPDCSVLQAGDTVASIQLFMQADATGSSGGRLIDVLITNSDGTVSDLVALASAGSELVSATFTVDSLAAAWTLAKINDITGIEIRPMISGKDANDDYWAVYQLYLQINYTVASGISPSVQVVIIG